MTKTNISRVINSIDLFNRGINAYEHNAYSEGTIKAIRATVNKMLALGFDKYNAEQYFEGNLLADIKALEYFIIYDCKENEMHGMTLLEKMGAHFLHADKLKNMLRGLNATRNNIVYSDTNGLDKLSVRR